MENFIKPYLQKLADYFVEEFDGNYEKEIRQRINDTIFLSVDPANTDKVSLAQQMDKQLLGLAKQFCLDAGKILGINSPHTNLAPEELNDLKYYDVLLKSGNSINDETYIDFVKILEKIVQNNEILPKNREKYIKDTKNKEIIADCMKSLCELYNATYYEKMQNLTTLKRQLLMPYNIDDKTLTASQNIYYKEMQKALCSHLSKILGKNVDKNSIILDDFEKYFFKPADTVTNLDKQKLTQTLSRIAHKMNIKLEIDENFWNNFEKDNIRKQLNEIYRENCLRLNLISKEKNSTIEDIDSLNLDDKEKDILRVKIAEYILNDETAGFSFYTKSVDGKNMRVCILPPLKDLNDALIFHEISHSINAPIERNKEGIYSAKSGFTLFVGDKNRENNDLDEIITDYFALKTQKLAKNDNFRICKNKDELSLYSCGFMLFGNFLENYTNEINACRMSGDPYILNKTFGEENITTLSSIATQFFDLIDTPKQSEIIQNFEQKYGFDVEKIDFSQKPKSYFEKQYLNLAKTMKETLKNIHEFQNNADSENSL